MLCCLSSHACLQVTRISTSTARLCKGGLGRRRGAPHGTARTDGGQRTGSTVHQRRADLRRWLAGAQLQPVLSMVLDEVFIIF